MNTIKRNIISFALTILVILSAATGILFGMVMIADILPEEKLLPFVGNWISPYFEEVKNQEIEQVLLYMSGKEYDKIKDYAEAMNFDFYISTKNGTPVARSDKWYENSRGDGDVRVVVWGPEDEYNIWFYFRYLPKNDLIILCFNIWHILRNNMYICLIGAVICLGLFILSIWLLEMIASISYKVFLLLSFLGIIRVAAIVLLKLPGQKLLVAFVICEMCFLFLVARFYIKKLNYIHKKVRAISQPADNSIKKVILPRSLRPFSKDVDEATESIAIAVKERLKSERLKTELISNVSHDLKTPLTSIINFSDLISQETTDNANISEYAEHLHKQSIRLKDLMDFLIEASKASSGAIEIELVPCKVKTLLEQCFVEYEEKLQEKGITFVDIPFDGELMILGDGKALCRVFENLLNNISKYALPGSRAYIEVKKTDANIIISFKNVSAEQIHLSGDELTERFVRGDASRHSEGHGLGLSIVKSLMDLMNGGLVISAEYDMFVVELIFQEYILP